MNSARKSTSGQKRVSGEPYITHPVAVADILADLRLDADTLVAAILHDVIEDTPTAKAEIASIFGQVVAELVDGVSKLDQIQFKNRQEAQAESFRKMLLAMVRDIRVIMVKLADRMHNMRTLGVMPPVKRRRSARETLEIYAPIAERLGLYAVKLELEDLGFRALYPVSLQGSRTGTEAGARQSKGIHRQDRRDLQGRSEEGRRSPARVEGREKHLYSIYKKMQNKKISLNEMVDVYGFRIIVDNADTCYRDLGIGAQRLQAHAGALQGLHRHSARQRLPVAAHDAVRTERRAHRGADPLRANAPRGRVRHRRALEVQIRRRHLRRRRARSRARVAGEPGADPGGRQLRGIPGERQGRPVPRQGLRVHAEGKDPAPADRRHHRGLRLRHPHRRRQSLRRRQGRPAPGAAAHAAAQRPDRGDHHGEGRDAESVLVELPGDGEGARRDHAST